MDPPYSHAFVHPMAQPFAPMYPAQQAYDSAAVYGVVPVSQPPPPPKWTHTKNVQGKRGGYTNKHNFRVPSTKVNIKKIRQQNAKGARNHFKGLRVEAPRDVPPAPYNSNSYLCEQSGRRKAHRGRGRHHLVRKRSEHVAREQTPSTIQQTPDTVSERLRVPATQAGWTAGSDTLTSAEVAMGSNFDPLGSCMLLKKEYDTDEDEDENESSPVKNQLQKLSGQIESLYDENKKLKERLELQTAAATGDGVLHNLLEMGIGPVPVLDAVQLPCKDGFGTCQSHRVEISGFSKPVVKVWTLCLESSSKVCNKGG
ncbi:hypothetical protein WJX79_005443 [Trebouxia sp. C0005]